MGYGQQVGVTLPTGMHSCCDCDSYSPYKKERNHNRKMNQKCEWIRKDIRSVKLLIHQVKEFSSVDFSPL